MSVKAKLIGGFAAVAFLGMMLGALALFTNVTISKLTGELHDVLEINEDVIHVMNDRFEWRQALMVSALTGNSFTASTNPNTCELGIWLSGDSRLIKDSVMLDHIALLREPHAASYARINEVAALINAGDREAAADLVMGTIVPQLDEVIRVIAAIEYRTLALIEEIDHEIEAFEGMMNVVIVVFMVIVFAITVPVALKTTNSIIRPLLPLEKYMMKAGQHGDIEMSPQEEAELRRFSQGKEEIAMTITACLKFIEHIHSIESDMALIADGDLTAHIHVSSGKDSLGLALEKMEVNLNNMFSEVNSCTEQVGDASRQIAEGAQSLAQASTEQAASIEELSSSISELSGQIKDNAGMADECAMLSNDIRVKAEKGSNLMDDLMNSVHAITDASNQIEKVIKVIDDIAFQTNILALNAAVEAARAGDAGKGFAVVAEEVRNLASKSAAAAKNTSGLIGNSIDKATQGLNLATETSASLREIVDGINQNAGIVGQIAQSTDGQSIAISQLSIGVEQIAKVIQQNSATAQESAAASEEMSGQANILKESVAHFKTKN